MWKSFSQNSTDPPIYLKVEIEDRCQYRISVTNYVKLWTGVFDTNGIINIMLASNKDVETEDNQKFLNSGLHMLRNPQLIDKKHLTEEENGNLCIKLIRVSQIVLKMCFSLKLSTAEDFFYSVTRPLLEIIDDQMHSEKELRHFLLKKNEEIKGFLDMLPENSPLMRCLRTDEYNDDKHMNNHSALAKLLGTENEQGICPKKILCGNPLPIQQYNREHIKKEEKHVNLEYPNGLNKTDPLPLKRIKVEQINSDGSSTSNGLTDVNTTDMISAIKIEPNDIANKTSGPNDDPSKPLIGPKSDTIIAETALITERKSIDKNQLKSDVKNHTSTLTPAVSDALNRPASSSTDVAEQSRHPGPRPMDQDSDAVPTPDSQLFQNIMLIKRRKKLNY